MNETAATPQTQVTWIGRVIQGGREASVRVHTSGTAPTPRDHGEIIDDPFADPEGDPWSLAQHAEAEGDPIALDSVAWSVPVRPSKVIGIGRNYRAHAAELGNEVPSEPMLFLKAPNCLIASGQPVALPRGYERIDMEAELVVVIGRRARAITVDDAWEHIAGYTLGNDLSNRDLQRKDKQWTRAKGFDGAGPLGPFVRLVPPGYVPPIESMYICGELGDERCQYAPISDMIFSIPQLLAYITQQLTLLPGDVIYTGTPEGVRPLSPGQITAVSVEGLPLGRLTNTLV